MSTTNGAPGKSYRKGISLKAALQRFGDDAKAEAWFVSKRWPDGIRCAYCESDAISNREVHAEDSPVPLQGLPEELHRQDWHHHARLQAIDERVGAGLLSSRNQSQGRLQHETTPRPGHQAGKRLVHGSPHTGNLERRNRALLWPYRGGRDVHRGEGAHNKHFDKKLRAGRGPVGKTAVVGAKDRDTGQITARPIAFTDKADLQGFVLKSTEVGSVVYTDEAAAYEGMPHRSHWAIKHSAGEYVKRQASTNGIESFWALMKRGLHGTYHHVSVKHLGRYVDEFSGRHNVRPLDTQDQMGKMAAGMVGKRLTYADLIGPKDTRQPRML